MSPAEFVQLIEEHKNLIHKVCRLYGHTPQDQQDLFQEIVIQLWKAIPRFRQQSKLSTWMYRVALNTAISGYRKHQRSIATTTLDEVSAAMSDTNATTEKEEKLNLLYAAISQLTEIEKAIVMLYMDDNSYEEMEEILGINQNNLRVKMNRLKEKLRQLTKTGEYGL